MSNHPSIQQYADAELRARRLQTEAREQKAQTGVNAALKKVNQGLGQHLDHALANSFDSIRILVDNVPHYLKKQVKRTAKPVTPEDILRAFDTLRPADLRSEQEAQPLLSPIEILVSCLFKALEANPSLYSCSDRIILDRAPLRFKRALTADSTDDIRVYDATPEIVSLAKRQLELKRAKAQLDEMARPKTKRAKALRDDSAKNVDEILELVAREEARGVQVIHRDPMTGSRLRLMKHTRVLKAKPVTVPMLKQSGLLKRVVEAAVDPSVYGPEAGRYLQREVRQELLASFNHHHAEHIRLNTSTVDTVRVQTLPGTRPVRTDEPVPRANRPNTSNKRPPTASSTVSSDGPAKRVRLTGSSAPEAKPTPTKARSSAAADAKRAISEPVPRTNRPNTGSKRPPTASSTVPSDGPAKRVRSTGSSAPEAKPTPTKARSSAAADAKRATGERSRC